MKLTPRVLRVTDKATGNVYILMEARLEMLFKGGEQQYEVLEKMLGSTLHGKSYQPILPYFVHVSDDFYLFLGPTSAIKISCILYLLRNYSM